MFNVSILKTESIQAPVRKIRQDEHELFVGIDEKVAEKAGILGGDHVEQSVNDNGDIVLTPLRRSRKPSQPTTAELLKRAKSGD